MTEETNQKRAAQCFALLQQAVDELEWDTTPGIMGMGILICGQGAPDDDDDAYYDNSVDFGIAVHPEREDFTIGSIVLHSVKGERRMEFLMAIAAANECMPIGEYLYRPSHIIGSGANDGVIQYFLRQNFWEVPGTLSYFKELLQGLYEKLLPTKRRFLMLQDNEILLEDFIREERAEAE